MRWFLVLTVVACGSDTKGPDAAPVPDAALADGGPGLQCTAAALCPLGDACCIETVTPPRPSYFCVPGTSPGACQGTSYFCDGPEDCAEGELCCGLDGTTCQAGSCPGTIACHTLADCPPLTTACAATPLGLIRICR